MMSRSRQCVQSLAALSASLVTAVFMGCNASDAPDGDGGKGGASGAGASSTAGAGLTNAGASSGASSVAGAPSVAGTTGSAGASGAVSDAGGAGSSGGSAGSASVGGNAGATAAGAPASGGSSGSGERGGSGGASGSGGSGGAVSTCPSATPLTGGKKYCSNSTGNAAGNYTYELWSSGVGTGCMNVYGADAAFSATWSKVDDFLARVGLGFDRSKTPTQIGTLSADFAETKTGDTGLVYVGIYGWTVEPLREYYILEDWGSTKPAGLASDGTPRDNMGTITVDGATYDVWKKTRTDKPAITGDHMTFDQYFSIRQTARQCGHISISEHFSKWTGLGLKLGKLVEAKLLLEAQDSSGTIDFTTAKVVVK
ncbi:MAG TPA: glycoside hydrolase family 11 protein [Polyangiaceae bacterium]|nr:glycoside hydrolase family 11 protein [Polyangiaceae bacterium]